LLSLAGFAIALIAADRDVYPWNANVCRPCQCSDELVLERCNYEGESLVLSRRGITGIKASALNGAPNVKNLRLSLDNIKMLPRSAFDGASGLEVIQLGNNKIGSLEAGALRNLPHLKRLELDENALSSLENFNGTLNDLPSLDYLFVVGNDVTCEDLLLDVIGNDVTCYDWSSQRTECGVPTADDATNSAPFESAVWCM
jgi:hypothetical protein